VPVVTAPAASIASTPTEPAATKTLQAVLAPRLAAIRRALAQLSDQHPPDHPKIRQLTKMLDDLMELEKNSRPLEDAQAKLADLRQRHGDGHPAVVEQQKQIEALIGGAPTTDTHGERRTARTQRSNPTRDDNVAPAQGAAAPAASPPPPDATSLVTPRPTARVYQDLARGPTDFEAMESDPEILRIQLRHAELEHADIVAKRSVGVATDVDVQQAAERIELFRAKLDNDPVRFARAKYTATAQRLEHVKTRYNAGRASGIEVSAAEQDAEIARVKLRAAEAKSQQAPAEAVPAATNR
jgi:hypothetical protein